MAALTSSNVRRYSFEGKTKITNFKIKPTSATHTVTAVGLGVKSIKEIVHPAIVEGTTTQFTRIRPSLVLNNGVYDLKLEIYDFRGRAATDFSNTVISITLITEH